MMSWHFKYIKMFYRKNWAYQVALVAKNPHANAGDVRDSVQSLGSEDPLEKGMATHSSFPGWRIPRTEEPGGPQSIRPQRVRHDRSDSAHTRGKN